MKYQGSKNRIANKILPIILKNRYEGQWYIEPFVGGCNTIDKVGGARIGSDNNKYLIAMWKALQEGWTPKQEYSREIYNEIKNYKYKFPNYLVGYVGINCSYSGKWFGGYAGKTKTKTGVIRDYQREAWNNIMAQIQNIKHIDFKCLPYDDMFIPWNSIIYCDPPYKGTTKYHSEFNHEKFWEWCNEMVKSGNSVFVSEYNAPEDWTCVWQGRLTSSLSANGKIGGNKVSTEKLFVKTK